MNQIVNVAKKTSSKNEIIKSSNVAVLDVKKNLGPTKTPESPGTIAFTLPRQGQSKKNLQNCEMGSGDITDDTILLVRT